MGKGGFKAESVADDTHRSATALRYMTRLDERSWTIVAGLGGDLLDNMRC